MMKVMRSTRGDESVTSESDFYGYCKETMIEGDQEEEKDLTQETQ